MKLLGLRSATLLIVLLVFCAAICHQPVNVFTQTPYWPMIGYDKAHTGHNTTETNLYPPFPFETVYPLGNGLGGLSSYEGTLFSTTETDSNRMNAMDIATGGILWSVPIPGSGGGPSHTPAVWDTLVYGSGQHADGLHCLNTRTGDEVWFRSMGSLFEQHVTLDDGRVYAQARADRLYSLDGLTGSVIWSRPSENAVVPAIVGDTIFAFRMEARNGPGSFRARMWEKPTTGAFPAIIANGVVYEGVENSASTVLRGAGDN